MSMQLRLKRVAWGLLLAAGPAWGAPSPAAGPGLTAAGLASNLNDTIRWHRQVQASRQWVAQPSDDYYWNNQRTLANQVVQAAFAAARGELPLVAGGEAAKPTAAAAQASATAARISAIAAARAARVRGFTAEINTLNGQIAAAPTAEGTATRMARRDALQAEVDLFQAMQDNLQKLSDLVGGPADQAADHSLGGQIDALQQSVPEAFAPVAAAGPTTTPMAANTGGLIKKTVTLFSLAQRLRGLDELIQQTVQLQAAVAQSQAPLRAMVRAIVAEGDTAAGQVEAAPTGPLLALRQKLQGMSAEFRELSIVSLPLRQESMLFDQSLTNLREWRDAVNQLYGQILWALLGRVAGILAMLAAVFGISEIWRRMTLRYVPDERRRRQFLLIRRVVTGVLMLVVFILGFISDFSSLATFAGVITAGIAVALQTIILSIAAYFFMIGRSGLRVGDRISIAGVTGDVMHVGPVRFYVRELDGATPDAHPTGRMAIFSNSVIFQHSPLFRPLPPEPAQPGK